jgi:8-oxo-dGTP pyrophosphatase MutT (NUDIX family)
VIALQPWPDFKPDCEVVSCLVWHDNHTLLLRRAVGTYCPLTWGCPTGKMEANEARNSAMLREIEEESGLQVSLHDLEFHETLYVRHPELDFIYHLFSTHLKSVPEIRLSPAEHDAYRWLTLDEAVQLRLVPDMPEVLERYCESNFVKEL